MECPSTVGGSMGIFKKLLDEFLSEHNVHTVDIEIGSINNHTLCKYCM